MAALIDDVRRVRGEAALIRRRAEALRDVAVRACLQTERLRGAGIPSGWSELRWSPPSDDLNEVLELVT